MKSIEATLKLVGDIVKDLRKSCAVDIALAGGYAVISHGVGRTTTDADFFLYSDIIQEDPDAFFELLKKTIPANFEVEVVKGSRILDDPFPYDIAFLIDRVGEYPRIDFIIARYKWELEGIRRSKPLEDITFPVLPRPYLIATKLKAGGPKDNYDILELYGLLSEEEKRETAELASLIKRDKKLKALLQPQKNDTEREGKDQLI